jgi:hypothetical protein
VCFVRAVKINIKIVLSKKSWGFYLGLFIYPLLIADCGLPICFLNIWACPASSRSESQPTGGPGFTLQVLAAAANSVPQIQAPAAAAVGFTLQSLTRGLTAVLSINGGSPIYFPAL